MKNTHILITAIIGAILSRFHGGGFFHSQRQVRAFLWSLPIAVSAAIITSSLPLLSTILISISILGLCMASKNTGHGGGMDLGSSSEEPNRGRTLERLEPLIYPWAFNILPRYWYDLLLMFIIGVATVLPMVVLLAFYDINSAAILLAGGAMKAFSYALGHEIFDHGHGSTEFGEIFSGFFAYGTLAIAHLMVTA